MHLSEIVSAGSDIADRQMVQVSPCVASIPDTLVGFCAGETREREGVEPRSQGETVPKEKRVSEQSVSLSAHVPVLSLRVCAGALRVYMNT